MTTTRRERADNKVLCAAIVDARTAHDAAGPRAKSPLKRNLDAAVNACIVANMGLVVSIAQKFRRRAQSLTVEDLVQEGAAGLHRALQTFEPDRGYALATYASHWIRQAIRRAIDTTDLPIRIPVGLLETRRAQGPMSVRLYAQHGRRATDEELMQTARVSKRSALVASRLDTSALVSLDKAAGEGETSLVEFLPGEGDSPEAILNVKDRERVARSLLETLTPRERIILQERAKGRTLVDVGEQFGVSRERIRQIERQAMRSLRRTARIRKIDVAVGA